MKREIDEELRFHLELLTAKNLAAGMAPEDAAREARKRFGNVQSFREECHDVRGANIGETTLKDVRLEGAGYHFFRFNVAEGFMMIDEHDRYVLVTDK